jgi:uncharacterized membrane protein
LSAGTATSPRTEQIHTPSRGRIAALDAARALGVVAMVLGHTLDALLAPADRLTPAVALYWKARGLTAPLFLMVSGWAVTVAIGRARARGLQIPRERAARVVLLLAVGYALRWPGWGLSRLLAGEAAVWAHLLAFDALHTIAVALLATTLVLALPWTSREKGLLLGALAVAAVTVGLLPPAPVVPSPAALPASFVGRALAQAAGGTSPFPLFPWAAYFFAGAVLALLGGEAGRPPARWLAFTGALLVVATAGTGVGTMPSGDPRLVLFRIGAVLLVIAALSAIPGTLASAAAPIGRASLGVYAIHVPIVYGWSTLDGLAARIGPTQPFGRAALVGAIVLAASLTLERAVQRTRAAASAAGRWTWARSGVALVRVLGSIGRP